MTRLLWVFAVPLLAVSGCGDTRVVGDAAAPAATATVTATVTETPTAGPSLPPVTGSIEVGSPSATAKARPPMLDLEVFGDGCGVIRSEPADGVDYRNLTWVFRDQHGFQVLGRNALGETQYRYFAGGTFDVVLEAFVDDRYAPVSNEVTVTC